MVVIRKRSRLVTFRVSAEEHAALAKSCIDCGARSIAEFARAATLQTVHTHAPGASLTGDLISLSKQLREFDLALADMRRRVRDVLGPSAAASGGSSGESLMT